MRITIPIEQLKDPRAAAKTICEQGGQGAFIAVTFRTQATPGMAALTYQAIKAWHEATGRKLTMMFAEIVPSHAETCTFRTLGGGHDID
jgi:hypothetical protein